MKTFVVGYCRVSTEEQASEGLSLETQMEKIRSYCATYDLELLRIIVDDQSGKTMNRPGVTEALAELKAGRASGIVVAKLDRLTRNVADIGMLLRDYFGEGKSFSLRSVNEHIDTATPAGRMLLNVVISFAQYERELIADRTREVLAHMRRIGKRTGGIPFGFDVADDGETLVKNEREQEVLSAILTLHRGGNTLRAIAAELNRRKVPTKKSGSWTHTVVKSILMRAAA